MARTFRLLVDDACTAMAIAEVINAEGAWATYIPGDNGPSVLAQCTMGQRDSALRMFGLDPVTSR